MCNSGNSSQLRLLLDTLRDSLCALRKQIMSKRQNKLLIKRGDIWYYQRRVPLKFGHVEARPVVRITLDTSSIETARIRCDALFEADNIYWASLCAEILRHGYIPQNTYTFIRKQYDRAYALGIQQGFVYKTPNQIVEKAQLAELMSRVELMGHSFHETAETLISNLKELKSGAARKPNKDYLNKSSIDAEFIDGYLQLSNNRKRDLRKYMQQIS